MAFTYILECADGSFYIGSTRSLAGRLAQHRDGRGAEYTKRRRPLILVWAGEFERIDEAFELEKQAQGWSREKRIALIEGRWDDLHELAKRGRRTMPKVLSEESRLRLSRTLRWGD